MRTWAAGGLLVLLLGSILLASDFWCEKPYTEWSLRDANRVLRSSPWAAQQAFGEPVTRGQAEPREEPAGTPDSPKQGIREDRDVPSMVTRQYFIRFLSAAPVRMALARRAVLEGRLSPHQAEVFIETRPAPGYVLVAIQVPPGQDRSELNLVCTKYLKSRAYLRLKSSKKRIPLEKYRPPSELGGWEAHLYFPRFEDGQDLLRLEEQELIFICELNAKTRLSRRFRLEPMVFRGKLEI